MSYGNHVFYFSLAVILIIWLRRLRSPSLICGLRSFIFLLLIRVSFWNDWPLMRGVNPLSIRIYFKQIQLSRGCPVDGCPIGGEQNPQGRRGCHRFCMRLRPKFLVPWAISVLVWQEEQILLSESTFVQDEELRSHMRLWARWYLWMGDNWLRAQSVKFGSRRQILFLL